MSYALRRKRIQLSESDLTEKMRFNANRWGNAPTRISRFFNMIWFREIPEVK